MDTMSDLYDEELSDEIGLLRPLLAATATRLTPLTLGEIDFALAVRHEHVCLDPSPVSGPDRSVTPPERAFPYT
jgi:hypothetical protein